MILPNLDEVKVALYFSRKQASSLIRPRPPVSFPPIREPCTHDDPKKGILPTTIWYKVTPSAQTSLANDIFIVSPSSNSSGAWNPGVPPTRCPLVFWNCYESNQCVASLDNILCTVIDCTAQIGLTVQALMEDGNVRLLRDMKVLRIPCNAP